MGVDVEGVSLSVPGCLFEQILVDMWAFCSPAGVVTRSQRGEPGGRA